MRSRYLCVRARAQGYAGKILRVDLKKRKIAEQWVTEELARGYIGGNGFGIKILYDELRAGVDPLAPENKLVFASGPLCGTRVPMASYYVVSGKSALTDIFLDQPLSGRWSAYIKQAGYDAVVVEGKAEKPVYIWIDDGAVQIKDAGHLWGKDTYATEKEIRRDLSDEDIAVSCIGPAGERLVRFAWIQFRTQINSRGGLGAVMGSKNLKAIAVRGSHYIDVHDADKLEEWVMNLFETKIKSSHAYMVFHPSPPFQMYRISEAYSNRGRLKYDMLPAMNWQTLEGTGTGIRNDIISLGTSRFDVGRNYCCFNCPLACLTLSRLDEGPYKGLVHDGPDTQSSCALGTLCGHLEFPKDYDGVVQSERLCVAYGMDRISVGTVIAFAMECFDRGYITKKDTQGLDLTFGNMEAQIQMIHRIALRDTQLGYLLGEGVKRAAEKIGHKSIDFAAQVKGLEMGIISLRAMEGVPLYYTTATRGGDIRDAWWRGEDRGFCTEEEYYSPMGKPPLYVKIEDMIDWKDVPKCLYAKISQDMIALNDSLGLCRLFLHYYECYKYLPQINSGHMEALNLVTGMGVDLAELRQIGERIYNLERAFNVREGMRRKDDWLPPRFFNEPVPNGRHKGKTVKRKYLNKQLDEYYEHRSWDKKTGIPTPQNLRKLGLENAAKDMQRILEDEKKTKTSEPKLRARAHAP